MRTYKLLVDIMAVIHEISYMPEGDENQVWNMIDARGAVLENAISILKAIAFNEEAELPDGIWNSSPLILGLSYYALRLRQQGHSETADRLIERINNMKEGKETASDDPLAHTYPLSTIKINTN